MFPMWFDMNARVWLHAQHVLLDNAVTMMRLVSGVRRPPGQRSDGCGGCGQTLDWAGSQAAPYQRCRVCGLIRFHARPPQPPAGSATSDAVRRVLAFRPRRGA